MLKRTALIRQKYLNKNKIKAIRKQYRRKTITKEQNKLKAKYNQQLKKLNLQKSFFIDKLNTKYNKLLKNQALLKNKLTKYKKD